MPPTLAWTFSWTLAAGCALAAGAAAASLLAVPGLVGVLGGGLAVAMIAIAVIDAREFIIPDKLVVLATALGLFNAVAGEPEAAVASVLIAMLRGGLLALAFFALHVAYMRLRGREGIGLGDVKLAAVAGVWLDWPALAFTVEVAALSALAVVALRALRGQRITGVTAVPFGLFFAPAIWLGWMFEAMVLRASL